MIAQETCFYKVYSFEKNAKDVLDTAGNVDHGTHALL